ncbi:hypothetical protein [Sulfurimonas sp. HSL-1716]|uniref:hypothetical protein n=1 Tax=Hydrocurvibacter sulfurireducens TaxID=3131937 RepID=UPI0031F80F79
MRVISLINGSMISESSSIYALHYAKELGAVFELVHIKGQDSLDEVRKSAEDLSAAALASDVENEFLIFENFNEFRHYVAEKDIDIIFCSTRQNHSIFDRSFAQVLIRAKMKTDLAVVKIVKLSMQGSVDKLILPIRDFKLSVKKFSFFTTFALSYDSKAEIYSIDKVSKGKMATIDTQKEKSRLKEIIFHLRHYFRLAKMLDFKFSVKHDYALTEGDRVKAHIANHGYDLAIVGGHHDRGFFGQHPIDILFKKPMLNIIYFIPYKDEQ